MSLHTSGEPTAESLAAGLAPLHRRSFLRLAGGLAATAWVSPGCSPGPGAPGPPPELRLQVLSPRTWQVLSAAAGTLLGPRASERIAAGAVDPAGNVDAWLARMPGGLGETLNQGLWLLELGVWPLLPKLAPFTSLPAEGRERILRDLVGSRLNLKRDLYNGLKSTICLAFYADPRSRELTGYPGPFGGDTDQMAEALRVPPVPS